MNIDTLHEAFLSSLIHPSIISRLYEITDYISDQRVNGYNIHKRRYKNWTLFFKDHEIVLIGSLTKYILGNNQGSISLEEGIRGLQRLEQDLHLPIFQGYVRRIDIAVNIIMKYPVVTYLNFLHSLPLFSDTKRYRRALEYSNTSKNMALYDKIAEQKKRHVPISSVYSGRDVLRTEMRFRNKNAITQIIGVENPTVEDILLHYDLLIAAWANTYRKINKETIMTNFSLELFNGSKGFKNYLMRRGLEAMGGFSAVERLIHTANASGYFKHASQMSHLKTKLREVASTGNPEMTINYVKELDEKVNDAELFALSESLPWDHYQIL